MKKFTLLLLDEVLCNVRVKEEIVIGNKALAQGKGKLPQALTYWHRFSLWRVDQGISLCKERAVISSLIIVSLCE